MARKVLAKESLHEVGVGTLDAIPAWESDPTDDGAIVRLDVSINGKVFFTLTDAEAFDGSYLSVEVTRDDLHNLALALTTVIHGGRREHVPGFGEVIIGPEPQR